MPVLTVKGPCIFHCSVACFSRAADAARCVTALAASGVRRQCWHDDWYQHNGDSYDARGQLHWRILNLEMQCTCMV